MKTNRWFTFVAALCGMTAACLAGTGQKWVDVPEAVRKTILANGGNPKSRVDLEGEKVRGLAVYEAGVRDKAGSIADLVITADGRLVETKHDDAADAAREGKRKTSGASKADKADIFAAMKFTHPREITNPWLPMSSVVKDILEGTEDGKRVRIERVAKPRVRRTFEIAGQKVAAFAVEDREFEDGDLTEVALDFFAQADDGTVLYLGEEVTTYKAGKVTGHEGSWMLGKDTPTPGVIFPGTVKVGAKFKSEDVSKTIHEEDEIVSVSEKVTTPAGTFTDCVKVRECLADGKTEFKYYAKGVGVVREQPSKGDVLLKTHILAR